jgi:hypothetical protein
MFGADYTTWLETMLSGVTFEAKSAEGSLGVSPIVLYLTILATAHTGSRKYLSL